MDRATADSDDKPDMSLIKLPQKKKKTILTSIILFSVFFYQTVV